jgi:hypothetical protein
MTGVGNIVNFSSKVLIYLPYSGTFRFITRSRKWVPPGLYKLIENPPKSPFFKGGFSEGFHKVPPFDKGGVGGISTRGQVKKVIY